MCACMHACKHAYYASVSMYVCVGGSGGRGWYMCMHIYAFVLCKCYYLPVQLAVALVYIFVFLWVLFVVVCVLFLCFFKWNPEKMQNY